MAGGARRMRKAPRTAGEAPNGSARYDGRTFIVRRTRETDQQPVETGAPDVSTVTVHAGARSGPALRRTPEGRFGGRTHLGRRADLTQRTQRRRERRERREEKEGRRRHPDSAPGFPHRLGVRLRDGAAHLSVPSFCVLQEVSADGAKDNTEADVPGFDDRLGAVRGLFLCALCASARSHSSRTGPSVRRSSLSGARSIPGGWRSMSQSMSSAAVARCSPR